MCHADEFKISITKLYEKFACEKCALEFEGNERRTAWKRQQGGMIGTDGIGTVEGSSPNPPAASNLNFLPSLFPPRA